MKSNLSFFLWLLVPLLLYLGNHYLIQGHKDLHLCFLLLRVLFFTFWSLVHFEIFLYVVWSRGPFSFFCMWICSCNMSLQLSQHHLLRDWSFSLELSWHHCQILVVLICNFLITNEFENLFLYLWTIWIFFLFKYLLEFCPFFLFGLSGLSLLISSSSVF